MKVLRRGSAAAADRRSILRARFTAMQRLHRMLVNRYGAPTSNETITAVIRLILNDIFFLEDTDDLRVHVEGALEMTRARGGLTALGGEGNMLAKMVVIIDFATAIIREVPNSLSREEIAEYTEFLNRAAHATPTSAHHRSSSASFATRPPSLDPVTAAIIQDVDSLLTTLLAQPLNPSGWQLHKLQTMLDWVQSRVSGAADVAQLNPSLSPSAYSPASSSSSPTSSSYTSFTPPHTSSISSSSSSTSSSSSSPHSYPHHRSTTGDADLGRAVRLSSLVYCRAIRACRPLSAAAQERDAREVAEAVWRVPSEVWEAEEEEGEWSGARGKWEAEDGLETEGWLASWDDDPSLSGVWAEAAAAVGATVAAVGGGNKSGRRRALLLEALVSILAPVLPAAATPRGGPAAARACCAARAVFVAAGMQLALRDWDAAVRVLGRVVELQARLRRYSQSA
ncbi:hypothetical protein VTH06DRAFT_3112 [Thermothelomyces fergusii]